jgi:hypothetical protein
MGPGVMFGQLNLVAREMVGEFFDRDEPTIEY